MKKTASIWEYKVHYNASIANCVCLLKTRLKNYLPSYKLAGKHLSNIETDFEKLLHSVPFIRSSFRASIW